MAAKIWSKHILHTILFFSAVVIATYDCPTPTCSTCVPIEVHDAPGVGLDLTTSYGYASPRKTVSEQGLIYMKNGCRTYR
jgi:hypothetical protein